MSTSISPVINTLSRKRPKPFDRTATLKPEERLMRKTSNARQAANQANAQHSTGPKTPQPNRDREGAGSDARSRTHGFCSAEILIASEEKEEFDKMAEGYHYDLAPEGETQQTLFDEIVAAAWQLRRMRRMETEACSGHESYTAILDDDVLQERLDRLARHKTRIERTFHRCLKEFKTIQNERYEQDTAFHSMESLIAARAAQQNSERTQPEPEPATTEPLPPDFFDKINRDFEEIDRGLAGLGCFATPPKPDIV
jgi:hypothetical protein